MAIVAVLSIAMCCSNEEIDKTPENTTSASIEQSEAGYQAATRALTMSATASTYYTAQVKEGKEWCTFDAGKSLLMGEIAGGEISLNINLKANTSKESRQAKIWVGFDNGDEFDLTITQTGNPNGTDDGNDDGSGDDNTGDDGSGDDGSGDDGSGDDGSGDDGNGGNTEEAIFEIDGDGNYVVEAEGGSVVVKVTTNLEYSVDIPEEAREWLSLMNVRAVREETLTFNLTENTSSEERSATVDLLDADNNRLQSITFKQSGATNDDNTGDDSGDDNTGDDGNDDGTGEDDGRITIAQAKAQALDTAVQIKESTVVAISTRSYLLYDGSDYILVYKNGSTSFVVGDQVEVDASVSEYGEVTQLQNPTAEKKVGHNVSFEQPTAEEFTGSKAEAFISNPYIKYVKLRGTLSLASNKNGYYYYNIYFSDSSSAIASLAYPSSEICPDSFDGQTIEVYGYTLYVTSGKYAYVIATSVEKVEGDDSGNTGGDDSGDDNTGDDNTDGDDNTGGDSGNTGGNTGSGDAVFYRDWAELPLCNDRGSNFQYVSHGGISVGGKSNQRNYTMCFDKANKAAIWVAYPIHSNHIGDSGRTEKWAYDPKIATQYQMHRDYTGKSYDRGHQLPSGSRTGSKEMNYATFYFSNMTPQASQFNQGVWNNLEQKVRKNICSDTLYVVTGALFKGNNDSSVGDSTTDDNGDVCPVPSHYFKVLLRTKSGSTGKAIKNITSASDVKAIAILMKHKSSSTLQNSDFISVKELEEFSGITFFPILNDAIEADVKNQCSRSSWDL